MLNPLRILPVLVAVLCLCFLPKTTLGQEGWHFVLQPSPVEVAKEAPAPAAADEAPAEAPAAEKAAKKSEKAKATAKKIKKDEEANEVKKAKAEKVEAPPGYEDAPKVGEKPAAKKKNIKKVNMAVPARPAGNLAPAAAITRPAAAPPTPVKADKKAATKKDDEPKEVDPKVLKIEKQYRSGFKQLLTVELAFMRRACKLDKKQREAALKAGKEYAAKALRQCAIAQNERQQRGRRTRKIPDPRKLMREYFMEFAKKFLRPEQVEKYRQESEKRDAHHKQAVINYLIAKVDDQIMLSSEQRNKLSKTLASHYQDDWGQMMPMWLHNPHLMPSIPNGRILPILDKHQKSVWRQIPRRGNYYMDLSWMLYSQGSVIRE